MKAKAHSYPNDTLSLSNRMPGSGSQIALLMLMVICIALVLVSCNSNVLPSYAPSINVKTPTVDPYQDLQISDEARQTLMAYDFSPEEARSRAEILARAERWISIPVKYGSYNNDKTDDIFEGYRADCSGFVSMAWQIQDPTGKPLSPSTDTLGLYAHQMDLENIRPGDALNNQRLGELGHVVLFVHWLDDTHTRFVAYEENGGRYGKAARTELEIQLRTDQSYTIRDYDYTAPGPYVVQQPTLLFGGVLGEATTVTPPLPHTLTPTLNPAPFTGQIAYVGEDFNIWILRGDERTPRQITIDASDKLSYSTPYWSPDGKLLAYTASISGDERTPVYLYDLQAGSSRLILEDSAGFSWTPDSQALTYGLMNGWDESSLLGWQVHGVDLVDIQTGKVSELMPPIYDNSVASSPVWTQDSRWLMVKERFNSTSYGTLFTYQLNDKQSYSNFEGAHDRAYGASFSPFSDRLVFNELPYNMGQGGEGLYTAKLDGSGIFPIYSDTNKGAGIPSWSPDGKWIAFLAFQIDPNYPQIEFPQVTLTLVSPDGKKTQTLQTFQVDMQAVRGNPVIFEWSPTGQELVYRNSEGDMEIYSLATGQSTTIANIKLAPMGDMDWSALPYMPPAGYQSAAEFHDLNGIWMVSSTDGWAVGRSGQIVHWDGVGWKEFPSPTDQDLLAVSLASSTDGWAVGYGCTVLHWDGNTWQNESIPVSGSLRYTSVAVLSPQDVWVSGIYSTLHWDGNSWKEHYIQMAAKSISGASGDSLWTGGFQEHGSPFNFWDGMQWQVYPGISEQEVTGLSMLTPSDGWALGGGLYYHWNGSKWLEAFPFARQNDMLNAIDMLSTTDGWAVGSAIYHWSGTSWDPITKPTTTSLNSVYALASDNVWAVGGDYGENRGTILHWDGSKWIPY